MGTDRLAALAALFLLAGCERHRYQLELEPRGTALHRELSHWVILDEGHGLRVRAFPDEDRARIEAAYAGGEIGESTAAGEFAGALPDDLGGGGRFLRFESDAGDAVVYVERDRGTLDPWSEIERIERLADRTAGVLRAWFESELAADPRWPALAAFLDGPFRRDLENLALHFCFTAMRSSALEPDGGDAIARALVAAGQFLADRGYVAWEDLPLYAAVVDDPENAHPELGYRLAQRVVARRMGIPDGEPLPDSLAFLASDAAASASFAHWFEGSELAAAGVEADSIADDVAELIDFELFESILELEVELRGVPEPLLTNGVFDAEAGAIRWPAEQIEWDRSLPGLRFAFWVEPDAAWQREHLGEELSPEELFEHALRANVRAL